MEKVDLIIAGVGAVAILATVLGVVFYEEIDGKQDVEFQTGHRAVSLLGGNVDQNFQTAAGNNATGAWLNVTVTFDGEAYNPDGDASVEVRFTDPNGTVHIRRGDVPIPDGPSAQPLTGGEVTLRFNVDFLTKPANTETDDLETFEMMHMWDNPYMVSIAVTPPGDTGNLPGPLGGQGASYTFSATFELMERYYFHVGSVADPENI